MSKIRIKALETAFDHLYEKKEYRGAFEIGFLMYELGIISNTYLRNLASASFYCKRQRYFMSHLLKEVEFEIYNPYIENIIAGLSGNLKDDEINKKFGLEVSKRKPLAYRRKTSVKKMNVLILQTIASGAYKLSPKKKSFHISEGHNNLHSLLDSKIVKSILRVDSLDQALESLKNKNDIDIVINNITDSERCSEALVKAERICSEYNFPIINSPSLVSLCSRDNNYNRFKNTENILYPKNVFLPNVNNNYIDTVKSAIHKSEVNYPLIVRVAGYHAGKNMFKIDSIDDSSQFLNMEKVLKKIGGGDLYFIEYIESCFYDERIENARLHSKFRAMLANGVIYPIHLFVSKNEYNVHKDNSKDFMANNPWLIEIEKNYCNNPESIVGKNVWESIYNILLKTGLDYVGVDFSVIEENGNKKAIIFEINPAMRNSMYSLSDRPHTQEAWRKVTFSVHQMLCEKSNIEPWKFEY